MGERWSVDRGDIAVGNFRLTSGSPRELVGWHNADCDAYEARIAELEAELSTERINAHDTAALSREWADAAGNLSIELARVRAESLRVDPTNWDVPTMAADLSKGMKRQGALGGWMSEQGIVLHLKAYLLNLAKSHEQT